MLSAKQAAILHTHRFLGNVAAHEIGAAWPTVGGRVRHCRDVIENYLCAPGVEQGYFDRKDKITRTHAWSKTQKTARLWRKVRQRRIDSTRSGLSLQADLGEDLFDGGVGVEGAVGNAGD